MILQYPFEVQDAKGKTGRNRLLGTIPCLFPAYLPTFASYDKLFSTLTDHSLHLNLRITRTKSKHIMLTDEKETACFNLYWFEPSKTDHDIVDYLNTFEGWTPSIHRRIKSSTSGFRKLRIDQADKLYQWEEQCLSKQTLSNAQANRLVQAEFKRHALPFFNHVEFLGPLTDRAPFLGHCVMTRYAGFLSRPAFAELQFYDNPRLVTVLHEIAHVLDMHYYRAYSHGPTFLKLYAALISRYTPFNAYRNMCDVGLIVER